MSKQSKLIAIDAIQFDGNLDLETAPSWLILAFAIGAVRADVGRAFNPGRLVIKAPEGGQICRRGDWIVCETHPSNVQANPPRCYRVVPGFAW